jgi:VWFA-related protein
VFSDQPELRVPLTNSHSRLAAGLDGIEAAGETTLYDSVVFGLYYMVGLRGKRALILLTDGVDSQSKYSFDDTLEFARFSGVAVYSIGIGISRRDYEAQRVLRQLASQTGGDCYFINSARELERIYSKIEGELRSQYLIGYQSSQSGSDEFRRVEIHTARPDLEVKTVPGYYP